MSIEQVEILAIAMVTAAGCALVGTFLMLRRLAMLADAVSHAILPGIVVAFFVTGRVSSPWLVLAAALTGVLTVVLVEALTRSRRLHEDAAMGIVFPALFSLGVVLIARYAGNVHLDLDAVLLGELAFAPFDRLVAGGHDLGPRHLWLMGTIALLNASLIALFFKELKLATFDPGLAAALGLAPGALHYGLMTLVSITAVGAFDAVGLVLVVALMVGPPAAAYLLTDRLSRLLGLAVLLGALAAGIGFALAVAVDASLAGCMAVGVALVFAAVYVCAPARGLASVIRRRRRQKWAFAEVMLAIHLLQHEGDPREDDESRVAHLHGRHVGWAEGFTRRVVAGAVHRRLVDRDGDRLRLTERGRALAGRALSGEEFGVVTSRGYTRSPST